MKTKNWRSTLGGACAAFGTFLFGGPVVVSLTSIEFPHKALVVCMVAGFILQGLGVFFGHLYSADAKEVQTLTDQVQKNTVALDVTAKAAETGDTSHLRRDIANAQTVVNLTKP